MRRFFSCWLAMVCLLGALVIGMGAVPALAQNADVAKKVEDALKQTEPKKLDPDDLKIIIQTLEDPSERQDFLLRLKAFQNAQQQQQKDVAAKGGGVQALDALSRFFNGSSKNFSAVMKNFADLNQVSRWLDKQWQSEEIRRQWLALCAQMASALLGGFTALFLLRWLLRSARKNIATRSVDPWWRKAFAMLGYHILALLPIAAFTAAALFTLNFFELPPQDDKAMMAFLSAFIVSQALVWVMQIVFAERIPTLRFIPLGDESAAYLFVWGTRFSTLMVFGYFLAQAAEFLEVPKGFIHPFSSLVELLVTLMVVVMVLQNRANVAAWIRGRCEEGRPKSFWQNTRYRLADIWHVLVILYAVGGFFVATLNLDQDLSSLMRATLITLLTLVCFHFLLGAINRLVAHGFALPEELTLQFPSLEARTNSYLPLLQWVMKAIAWIAAVMIVLGAWGIDTSQWFSQPLGKKIVTASTAIGTTLFFTVVLWEVVGNLVDRYLQGKDAQGQSIPRSARMRTLLPLLRHALYLLLVIIAILIILAQLGVDITPILAGAGIIGLAIGFGAQTLVKDFITGLFILLEGTISVGDAVVIASNHSGVVESITIRTLRLRDDQAHVHSIPFSEVTSIINKTRGFAYVTLNVGVGYQADLRQVMQVMVDVCEAMRQTTEWQEFILQPMDMFGVARFDPSSIIISARIKTEAQKQWAVRFEYQLRLKDAFDRAGIEMPYPIVQNINIQSPAPAPIEAQL